MTSQSQSLDSKSFTGYISPNGLNKTKNAKLAIGALSITGITAGIFAVLGVANMFGPIGSSGFISSLVGGTGTLSLTIGGIVWITIRHYIAKREIDFSTIEINSFKHDEIHEATQYLGKRRELWLQCQRDEKPSHLLLLHSILMRDQQDQAKGFLWEIELNGQKAYLYGSHHLRFNSAYDFFPYVFNEAEYRSEDEADIAYESWLKTIYDKAQTCLPDQVFNAFSEAGKELYFEVNEDDRTTFHLQSSRNDGPIISMKSSEQAIVSWLPFGTEWLLSKAGRYKQHYGHSLERMEEAIVSTVILQKALAANEKYCEIKEEISLESRDAWQFGNWEEFEEVYTSMPLEVREAINGQNNCRNENFAEKIFQLLQQNKKQSPFIVIGAGHFPGKAGLIALLEKKGVHIKFINL